MLRESSRCANCCIVEFDVGIAVWCHDAVVLFVFVSCYIVASSPRKGLYVSTRHMVLVV